MIAPRYTECPLCAVFTQLPERSISNKLTLPQTVNNKYPYTRISAFRNNYKYANVAMMIVNDMTSSS